MATKEIKQRIVLEGEKEYNAAIREAQRNLKTLKSELKAETAELGSNATAQQKAETRAKSLKQQIAEQEKIVKTLRDALEAAKEEYSDNEDVIQKWEQKLNNARASLADMQNELAGTGSGMKTLKSDADLATVAAKSVADSIGRIADVGGAVSDRIGSLFTGMVSAIGEAISAVWGDMMELAAQANEWGDIAGIWNTDAANVEKWERAAKAATGDFSAMLTAVQKINDLTDTQQKKITEWTGVSGVNYTDRWEYAMAVLDSMSRMDYQAQLRASEDIFGAKRAGGIIDVLNDWAGIREVMSRFDAEGGGLGLTNEQLEQMTELDVKVHTLQETWKAFVESFEAEHLAKLGLDLTGGAQAILDDLIRYLDSGDDAELAKLEEDIDAFFGRVIQAIENAAERLGEAGSKLEESDNGIVRAIGAAMSGLSEALAWLAEPGNIDQVITGFETLAAFWLIGKGAQLVGTIAELAANFRIIGGAGVLSGAAGASGGAGGLGGLISSAGYLAVGVMMVAPTVEKLLRGDTRSDLDKEIEEGVQNVVKDLGGNAAEQSVNASGIRAAAGLTVQDVLRYAMTGQLPAAAETVPEEEKRAETGLGTMIAPKSKFDLTAEQQEAAEAFWDAWRNFAAAEDDSEFDRAWEALENAFAGDENTFERLNTWLDKLYTLLDSEDRLDEQTDLPASWWKNPSGNAGTDGITSADLANFRGLPAQMAAAVSRGAASGIGGIQVQMDGYAVGRLVAPYVSEMIAAEIGEAAI